MASTSKRRKVGDEKDPELVRPAAVGLSRRNVQAAPLQRAPFKGSRQVELATKRKAGGRGHRVVEKRVSVLEHKNTGPNIQRAPHARQMAMPEQHQDDPQVVQLEEEDIRPDHRNRVSVARTGKPHADHIRHKSNS